MKTEYNIIKKTVISTIVTLLAASAVNAGNRYHKNNHTNVDYAKVVSVNEIYERVEYSKPVESCYDKQVRVERQYQSRYQRSQVNTQAPAVLGAIIGAAVGNQVGKRGSSTGKKVATLAGAVLGGTLVRDNRKRSHDRYDRDRYDDYERDTYKTVRHCETTYQTHYDNKVTGYDVEYRYRGQIYSSKVNERPGKRIKVNVKVKPALI